MCYSIGVNKTTHQQAHQQKKGKSIMFLTKEQLFNRRIKKIKDAIIASVVSYVGIIAFFALISIC